MAGNSHGNSRKNGNPAAHLKDYQFKPGQSGNPDGRPRGTKEFAELIAKETRDGAELVEYALSVLRSESAKAPKVWAVEYLTERMLGKAPQTIELCDNDPPNQMPEREYTEAELVALAAGKPVCVSCSATVGRTRLEGVQRRWSIPNGSSQDSHNSWP